MRYLIAMPQLQVVVLLLLSPAVVHSRILLTPAAVPGTAQGPPPDCPSKCGSVCIPYPFGINDGSSWNSSFAIACNHSYSPPRPYYRDYEVKDITLKTGEMRVYAAVAHICYNSGNLSSRKAQTYNFTGSPFLISSERNEFTDIGCHTVALLGDWSGDSDDSYLSGCVTTCKNLEKAAGDGHTCTGLGCCQTPTLPTGLDRLKVGWSIGDAVPSNRAWKYSSCSHGLVAEKGWYNFSRKHLNRPREKPFHEQFRTVPLVLDWALTRDDSRACVSNHSKLDNVDKDRYRCRCLGGYAGNPYVDGGCQNINECQDPTTCPSSSKCVDTDGKFECKCNFGRKGPHCRPVLATFFASVSLALLVWFMCKERKRRLRRGFFDKNGGEIFKSMDINTFTEMQLEKITNHYDTPIGRGAFGKVFRGTTHDNLTVAVKRSIIEGEKPRQGHHDLANELVVQFRISHPNLVRLVGCCLETDVPMLVFEYVSNGSLYDVLHCCSKPRTLPLTARLDIAIGSAEALAYMHSHGGLSLVHGDVKSGNILLGDNLTPKVSDFGSSKLVSVIRNANWCVMGDKSYIDPVYMKTGRFTEKSDVYSFGVVLLELITRKKAKYDSDKSLPIDFVKTYKKEGDGRNMYDRDIVSDNEGTQSHRYMEGLDRMGALAVLCLNEDVDERPTMAEVVEELRQAKLGACGVQLLFNDTS